MPSWHQLLEEIKVKGSTYDVVRRQYLAKLNRVELSVDSPKTRLAETLR